MKLSVLQSGFSAVSFLVVNACWQILISILPLADAASVPSSIASRLQKSKQKDARKTTASPTDREESEEAEEGSCDASEKQKAGYDLDDDDVISDCRLWMAPVHESRPEQFGFFTGVEYMAGDPLPNPETAIPLIDWIDSAIKLKSDEFELAAEQISAYTQRAGYVGSQWEGSVNAPVIIPGPISMAPQHNSGFYNFKRDERSTLAKGNILDDSLIPGKGNPMRGSVSEYSNVTIRASRYTPVGMQVFVSNENLKSSKEQTSSGNSSSFTATAYDYEAADQIIEQLIRYFEAFQISDTRSEPEYRHGMYSESRLSPEFQEDILEFVLENVLQTVAGARSDIIQSLIPSHAGKLKRVRDQGGSFVYKHRRHYLRTPEWLKKNGICIDSVRVGPSSMPSAGRGLFASRGISESSVITVSPVIPIGDRRILGVYKVVQELNPKSSEVSWVYDYSRPAGEQLALNYCFGQAKSLSLFVPLGPLVTAINHPSHGFEANAVARWQRKKPSKGGEDNTSLLEIAALRKIEPGEEILIDYGSDWDNAWRKHINQWKTEDGLRGGAWPFTSVDARRSYSNRPLETRDTIRERPYPPNIGTACFLTMRDVPDGQPMFEQSGGVRRKKFEWAGPVSWEDTDAARLFIVDILDRIKTNDSWFYNYTLVARTAPDRIDEIRSVPHDACTFVNRPYTSDMHHEGAFRHSIDMNS